MIDNAHTQALIAEARQQVGHIEDKSRRERLIADLADALEVATAAPAVPVEGDREALRKALRDVLTGASVQGDSERGADAVLAAGFSRSPLPVEGDVTDAEVLAALNAYEPRAATQNLDDWGVESVRRMRASLEAARSVTAPVEGDHHPEFYRGYAVGHEHGEKNAEQRIRAEGLPVEDEVEWGGKIVTASFEDGQEREPYCGLEDCECPDHEGSPLPAGTYITVRLDEDHPVGLRRVTVREVAP